MNREMEPYEKESTGRYYYRVGEETCGPVDAKLVKQKRHAGELPEETLFWKVGMTGWRFYRSVFGFRAVMGRVVSWLSGVQDSGVEWKGFFSQVWKRHTWAELREVFCSETEPGGLPLPRVNMSAPKPWLYMRILLWGIVLFVLAFMSVFYWPGLGFLLLMAVAPLVAPLTVLVMAYELNTRRDLSTMAIIRALTGVSIIAIPISISLDKWASTLLDGTIVQDHAWLAGFVKEPAKLITALVLAAVMRIRMNRVLRAVLLGCAVGAAFAYKEAWTLCFSALFSENEVVMNEQMHAVLGAIVASPGQVIWTGITVGAFAMAQVHWEQRHGEVRDSMFLWRNFFSWKFWRIAWVAIACHSIHNLNWGVFADPVLYLFACGVLWRLVRVGYMQMRETCALNGENSVAQFSRETWVEPLLRRLSIRFAGTMSRCRYWTLLLTVSGCLTGLGILTFGSLDGKSPLYGLIVAEFKALLIWFLLLLCSMMTRRLHDMGKSGKHTLYLVPLNLFFFLPALILGFFRGAGQETEEKDAPQPHSPVDNPEADPVQSMTLAVLPPGFMPCTECCVPGAEEKWTHCDVCGGSRRIPLVAKSSNEHAVRISLPWFAWRPSFKGRLTRKTYWGMTLIPVVVVSLFGVVQLQDEANTSDVMVFVVLFALLFFFVWGMGVTVRRLHDIGKSGWWLLLIVPLNIIFFFLPSIILGLIDSSPGANKWGANAKAWH